MFFPNNFFNKKKKIHLSYAYIFNNWDFATFFDDLVVLNVNLNFLIELYMVYILFKHKNCFWCYLTMSIANCHGFNLVHLFVFTKSRLLSHF